MRLGTRLGGAPLFDLSVAALYQTFLRVSLTSYFVTGKETTRGSDEETRDGVGLLGAIPGADRRPAAYHSTGGVQTERRMSTGSQATTH